MYIYILQFDQPLGNAKHTAQYYIGSALDVTARFKEHQTGQGAAITRACVERGISFKVVAVIPGDRRLERKLKNRKNTRRLVDQIQRGVIPC